METKAEESVAVKSPKGLGLTLLQDSERFLNNL